LCAAGGGNVNGVHDGHACISAINAGKAATSISRLTVPDLDAPQTNLYTYIVAPTQFRWIEWNRWQATKHGCTIPEIESVVRNAGRGFPRKRDRKKWLVIGRGTGDRLIEVLYLLDDDGTAFVIHAMPLTTRRRRG